LKKPVTRETSDKMGDIDLYRWIKEIWVWKKQGQSIIRKYLMTPTA